jgi:hypothetical protein
VISRSWLLILLALVPNGRSLQAQVGHLPARSPYTDLEYRQEVTFFAGYYSAGKDPAGVAPRSGLLLGTRYDLRLGGPAYLTVRLANVQSERLILDPNEAPTERSQGVEPWPLYLADVGIAMNLTGFKAYRRIVPVVSAAAGIVSDFKGKADIGNFKFGTPFALSVGAGVKWVAPSSRWQARLDVGEHLYQIKYPNSYYQSETGAAPILRLTQAKNIWKGNTSLTLGISYLLFR